MENDVREMKKKLGQMDGELKVLDDRVNRLSKEVAPDHEDRIRALEDSHIKILGTVGNIDVNVKDVIVEQKKANLRQEENFKEISRQRSGKYESIANKVIGVVISVLTTAFLYYLLPHLK